MVRQKSEASISSGSFRASGTLYFCFASDAYCRVLKTALFEQSGKSGNSVTLELCAWIGVPCRRLKSTQ